jgi:hypothetical protein
MNEELKRIKQIITQNLEEKLEFILHETAKIKGFYPKQTQETGFLFQTFTLFWMLRRTGLSEGDQYKVWEVLDDLSAKRQLKIFRCEISKNLNVNDIGMIAEIGKAAREWGLGSPKIIHQFFYWQPGKALSQIEFLSGERTIIKPSETVAELREHRDQVFRRRFGWRDFEIEKQLHQEKLEAESELNKRVERIANWIKKQEEKEKAQNA